MTRSAHLVGRLPAADADADGAMALALDRLGPALRALPVDVSAACGLGRRSRAEAEALLDRTAALLAD